jgi:phospholipid-transporting ATPase
MPKSYHIAQELQKYNIPDYRPQQEQCVRYCTGCFLVDGNGYRFQKAIKKVRAGQRMRRSRGFAFSQTESTGQQDQARIIRAYDTSQPYGRLSGY